MAMDVCGLAVLRLGWTYGYGVGNRPEGIAASVDLAFETDGGVWERSEAIGGVVSLTGTGLHRVVKRSSSSMPLGACCLRKRMNPMRAKIVAPRQQRLMYLTEDDFAFTGVGVDVATGM
jgi:hypothetical protein